MGRKDKLNRARSSIQQEHTWDNTDMACRLACFKLTMGPPNIMSYWHNMLHNITGWMQQKFKVMNRNWQVDNFSKFIKGKHGFYNGGITEKFEIPFLARKIYQYWSRVYQKMQNSNIWGGMFSKKNWFCQYFHEIILILDFFVMIWGFAITF